MYQRSLETKPKTVAIDLLLLSVAKHEGLGITHHKDERWSHCSADHGLSLFHFIFRAGFYVRQRFDASELNAQLTLKTKWGQLRSAFFWRGHFVGAKLSSWRSHETNEQQQLQQEQVEAIDVMEVSRLKEQVIIDKLPSISSIAPFRIILLCGFRD